MNRNYEIARGVRIDKNPETMTRQELVYALRQVADFAASNLAEARGLRRIVTDAIRGNE